MITSSIQKSVQGIGLFIAGLWAIYFIDLILPLQFSNWGIIPRRLIGLLGIPLSPFIHGSLGHLISNTIPLAILLFLFVNSRMQPWLRIAEIGLLSGLLLWLFGRNGSGDHLAVHVGASGLIYGLIAYLIVVGFREKHPVSLVIALLVGFLYGGTLLWGVLPISQTISWDGHLFGAVAGGILALLFPTQQDNRDHETPIDLLKRRGFDV